jgi:phage protein D
MDVTFGSAALANLCSSEARLAQRWDPDVAKIVGRRLFDLAASSAASLERIPGARVTDNGADEITITFAERIVLHGVLNRETATERGPLADVDHIVITSLEMQKGGRR